MVCLGERQRGANHSVALGAALCFAYVAVSALLINFNKFILQKFPHPWELTGLHMMFSSLLTFSLYASLPGLFPAMRQVEGRRLELFRYFLPLGCFFAAALYASNKAYLYCGIAFLQFMKESNVVLVFLMCCVIGTQKLDRIRGFVVVWILVGSWMCVEGEIKFSLLGFIIQAVSQLAECAKNVLGEYIMSGTNFKLDPLTYTMFMAPVALFFLAIGIVCTWEAGIWEAAMANWYLLIPNALLAYVLNVIIANVLKHCSAMGFILAGVAKDIIIVLASSHIFGDPISHTQYASFLVTLGGCLAWSSLKLSPDGVVAKALRVITMTPEVGKGESWPLMSGGSRDEVCRAEKSAA